MSWRETCKNSKHMSKMAGDWRQIFDHYGGNFDQSTIGVVGDVTQQTSTKLAATLTKMASS
jgi:hypothetical protein